MLQKVALETVEAERNTMLELLHGLDLLGDELQAASLELFHQAGQLLRIDLAELDLRAVRDLQQFRVCRSRGIVVERDLVAPAAQRLDALDDLWLGGYVLQHLDNRELWPQGQLRHRGEELFRKIDVDRQTAGESIETYLQRRIGHDVQG